MMKGGVKNFGDGFWGTAGDNFLEIIRQPSKNMGHFRTFVYNMVTIATKMEYFHLSDTRGRA